MRRIPAAELNFYAYRVSLMYGLPLPKLFKKILISDKTRGQYYNSCLSYSFKTKCYIKVPPFVLRTFFHNFQDCFVMLFNIWKKMFKNRYYVFVNLCGKSSNWKWYYNNALKMRYLSRQFSRQKVIWFSIVQIFTIEISIIHWLFFFD